MFTTFIKGLGSFLEWTFGILPVLGNLPNILFIIIGLGLIVYWTNVLLKEKTKA